MDPTKPTGNQSAAKPASEGRFRRMMVASSVCVVLAAVSLGAALCFAAYADPRGVRHAWPLLLAAGVCGGLAIVFRTWADQPRRDTWTPPNLLNRSSRKRRCIIGLAISLVWYAVGMYFLWRVTEEPADVFLPLAVLPLIGVVVSALLVGVVVFVIQKLLMAYLKRRATRLLKEQGVDSERGDDHHDSPSAKAG